MTWSRMTQKGRAGKEESRRGAEARRGKEEEQKEAKEAEGNEPRMNADDTDRLVGFGLVI